GRSRGGVHAEHPRDGDRDARGHEPRRRLVVLLARLRRGGRRGPLRPDRATHPVLCRRVSLRRKGDRLPRARRRHRRADPGDRAGGGHSVPRGAAPIHKIRGAVLWDEWLGPPAREATLEFERFPFNHPVYILYSSGTTGLPKCMVHGAGGTLLQHQKEHVLHVDLKQEDRLCYITTCGWMMWNWLVSALAVHATVVLYDGAPFAPRPDALWSLLGKEHVSVFGTSAKYLALAEKEGLVPAETHDLSALRTI